MSTSTSFRLKVLTALSLTTVLLIQAVIYTSCQQDTCIKDAKEASAIIIPACKKRTTNRRNNTSGRESHQGLTYTYI